MTRRMSKPVQSLRLSFVLAVTLLSGVAALSVSSFAQQNSTAGVIHVLPVSGNIYMLVGGGANVTASIGRDGVLLVDTGSAEMSDKVLDMVRQLSAAIAAPVPTTPCVGLRCSEFSSAYGWSST